VVCVHVLVVSVSFPSLVVTGPLSTRGGAQVPLGESECRHGCWGLPPKLHTAIVIVVASMSPVKLLLFSGDLFLSSYLHGVDI